MGRTRTGATINTILPIAYHAAPRGGKTLQRSLGAFAGGGAPRTRL